MLAQGAAEERDSPAAPGRPVRIDVVDRLAGRVEVVTDLDRFDSIVRLLERAAALDGATIDAWLPPLIDDGAAWSAAVGPVYTTDTLRHWLGVTRQAVAARAERGTILRLTTDEGDMVYPAFQFDPAKRPLPGLSQVLKVLGGGVADPWTWAAWLNTPDETGTTNAQRLRAGDLATVLAAAARDARAWRGED